MQMNFTKNIKHIAVFIEFLAGSGLAIFFHVVLEHEEAAYMIFGIGLLLALGTYLLREEIESTREGLMGKYEQAHELTFALARITDPECQNKANELIAGVKRTVSMLQQGFIPLDDTEFYLEGAKCSDQATRTIRAVDPLTPGWNTRGALVNFYQSNLRALDRGARITRIFVIQRDELTDPETQKVLATQYRDGIDVRLVFREEMPTASDISGRDTSGSCDFAIFDDRTVTDVFPQSGKYFGRKTSEPGEVAKYLYLFDLIEHSAHSVVEEAGRIILASEALALAS
jgi:hypothetical protein